VVEEIKVTLYLQYWNGSRWVDYISWTNTKTNATYVSNYKEVIPPLNQYYRVRGEHTAKANGITEMINSVTHAIYYQ
jgi:hypothetical protein